MKPKVLFLSVAALIGFSNAPIRSQTIDTSTFKPGGPVTMAVYYKVPPGKRAEWLGLYKKYHYPVMKHFVADGIIKSIHIYQRHFRADAPSWDYEVVLVWRDWAAIEEGHVKEPGLSKPCTPPTCRLTKTLTRSDSNLRPMCGSTHAKCPYCDHLTVDLAGKRLFTTPQSEHTVQVLDLGAGRLLHRITELENPHSVLYRSDVGRLYVTDGGAGKLRIYNSSSYTPISKINGRSYGGKPRTCFVGKRLRGTLEVANVK